MGDGTAVARQEQRQPATRHGVGRPWRRQRHPPGELWLVLHADPEELDVSARVPAERRALHHADHDEFGGGGWTVGELRVRRVAIASDSGCTNDVPGWRQ